MCALKSLFDRRKSRSLSFAINCTKHKSNMSIFPLNPSKDIKIHYPIFAASTELLYRETEESEGKVYKGRMRAGLRVKTHPSDWGAVMVICAYVNQRCLLVH